HSPFEMQIIEIEDCPEGVSSMLLFDRQRRMVLDELVATYEERLMDRRVFLRRAVALGLSLSTASSLLAACDGGTSAPTSIDVLNVWSSEELNAFARVIA